MRKKFKKLSYCITISIFLCLNCGYFVLSSRILKESKIVNNQNDSGDFDNLSIKNSGYWDLTGDPIFINDTDPKNNWSITAKNNDWCSGNGTWSDPYIIENITINGNYLSNGIEIRNSNKPFVIKNCTLYNCGIDNDYAGIYLHNVSNSKLFENNCSFNYGHGIHLRSSFNNTILHNFAKNNTWEGIFLRFCINNTISNNTVVNNYRGIRISSCWLNNTIERNYAYGNSGAGIGVYQSTNCTIVKNTVYNNSDGIFLMDCFNITIRSNMAHSNNWAGINLDLNTNNIIIFNNTMDNNYYAGIKISQGKELFIKKNNVFSNGWGINIQNCDNISILENNIKDCKFYGGIADFHNNHNVTILANNMSKCDITLLSNFECISTYLITTSNLVDGRPVYFYKNKLGLISSNFSNPGQIILFNCNYSLISNLNISGGGITLIFCRNNTISSNTIKSNHFAIRLSYSDNNTVFNNNLFNSNSLGIYLLMSDYCNITKNNIIDNYGDGIHLLFSNNNTLCDNNICNNSRFGVYIDSSNENIISKNKVINHSMDGIYIVSSSNDTLFDNYIGNNGKIGLKLLVSNENLIFNNFFTGNTLNAQDNGTNNQWDNGTIGNFWDDYIGYDSDLDRIGDIPYNISGSANSVDRFPQIIIIQPQITIEKPNSNDLFGSNPPEVDISIISIFLNSTWYTLSNESFATYNYTFTGEIEQDIWDSIGNGTVRIKFYANDSYGLIGYAEVIVKKDIVAPNIMIRNPIENYEFSIDAPIYNITVYEPHLEKIWYIINNIEINYSITNMFGSIDQDAWNSVPQGEVLITFYAQDRAGNIGTKSVVVIKSIPSKPAIPGYNLFLLIGVISVVSAIILGQRKKK